MYSNSSVLALRAKGSFYHDHDHHHHHCCTGGRAGEKGGCCGCRTAHPPCEAAGLRSRGILASPRFLYGYWLGRSALIRWSSTRIVTSGGGGGASAAFRYSRLPAACDRDPCPGVEWRAWGKYSNRRVPCRVRVSDESFQEMMGLLAEVEECFGEDDGAAAEETYVKEEVGFKSYGGVRRRFAGMENNTSREGDLVARRSESSSSYQSVSSPSSISGDCRNKKVSRRQDRHESSSSYSRNDEIAEKEVGKREDDSRLRRRYYASDSTVGLDSESRRELRTRDREENTASLIGTVHQSREQYLLKDKCFTGEEESREEVENVSKTSHVRQNSATERHVTDKKVFNVRKEETSAGDLLDEVRRQQTEIEQLRKDYQNLLRTTQVHNINTRQASASSSVLNTRVEVLGETSTLPMDLLEEVRKQRSEMEQLNENFQKFMRAYKMQESTTIRESNSTKSFGTMLENKEEISTSAVNFVEEGTEQYLNRDKHTIDGSRTASQNITETYESKKNHQKLKPSNIHESDIGWRSNYRKGQGTILEDTEKKEVSAINLVEEVQGHHISVAQDQQNIRCTVLGTGSHELTETAGVHSNRAETASTSQRHYVTRVGDQKESTSSAVKFIAEREERISNKAEQVSGHIDSKKISQKLTNAVEIHNNDMTKGSRTQAHVGTMVKDQEENSTSVQHLVKLKRDKRVQIDQQVIEEIHVSKDIRSNINISEAFRGEAHIGSSAFTDHEKNSVSPVNLVHEVQQTRDEDDKRVTQPLRLRNDSQQGVPELFEGGPANTSDLQMSSSTGTNSGDDYSAVLLVQEAKEKQKTASIVETFGSSSGTSESWYGSGHMQTHEVDYHTKADGSRLVKDDVLESARRLDKSSSHYVGEFVDQLQQKVSACKDMDTASYNSPEMQTEVSQSTLQKSKVTAESENEVCKKEGHWQHSAGSEVAGPSDEIWDVRGASLQEASPTEEHEKGSSSTRVLGTSSAPASTSGAIVKRSSRSLWSYIADIVRMGWRTHTSSQKSTLKSGTRSSSNESMNSDAWYSGHEPDDDQEENVKNGQIITKESEIDKADVSKPHSGTSSALGQIASEVTRPREKIMHVKLDASIPAESIVVSYGSNGPPPAPGLENLVPVDGEKGIEGIPSALATNSESALLGSTSVSTSEEETEISRVPVPDIGFIISEGEQKTERISEIVGIQEKDVELKRRKLRRKNQVLREEFEEWEEAYKLETEQRKIDEFFMREALLEAMKAADMWEVPVGAVLVQDGKIIARGCNLVEDLRDSTAHAEMICIREASSLLRTWRLAGTTLYVTLEPCPMCAGAILQARIDVVVWGAPNKLLGADGSWVRLFPGGDDGKQGLDQSSQMVGPVHPFHPKITIRRGVLAMECADAMQQFFQLRRKKKKPESPPPSCLPVSYPAKLLTKMHNIFCMMVCT